VGPGEFPGSKERPVSGALSEKTKGNRFLAGADKLSLRGWSQADSTSKRRKYMATNSIAISKAVETGNFWQGAVVVLGRFSFALIFLLAGANHFNKQTIGYAASQGVPLAAIAVPLSGVLAIAGGLSILLGYSAKLGAWLIVLFLVPVSVMMHKFWTVTDPMMAQIQMILFMKNVSMLGGALLISQFGAGPFSLDARRSR
jgi:putative oxidoreductase